MNGLTSVRTFVGDASTVGELIVAVLFACVAVIAISMIVVVWGDSASHARVSSAAKLAAEDAAKERSPDRAMLAAQRAAVDTLTDAARFGLPTIVVDVSRFQSAGLIEVTVACRVAPRPIGPIGRAEQLHQATASASSRALTSP